MNFMYESLCSVLNLLFKHSDGREKVLDYLAQVINKNAARAGINVNPSKCASTGMFITLGAVMLKLCAPFLCDPTKMKLVDGNYLLHENCRIDCRELTAINATSEEVATLVGQKNQNHPPETKYSFVTEWFFMTARVLNLALLKSLSEYQNLIEERKVFRDELAKLEAQRRGSPDPQLEQEISNAKAKIERLVQRILCYEVQILTDVDLLRQALRFYRLMLQWMTSLVGGFRMPLPAECPIEFSLMPEHFVEDAMELLLCVSEIPKALDGVELDDFFDFIVMFMASPHYVKNPYLRARMVTILNAWMPEKMSSSSRDAISTLFEGHPLALQHLVFGLIKVYVDIELTGAHAQFYDKFDTRHHIAQLLQYLWQVPSHHNSWKEIARTQEKGMYLSFLNFVINDTIFLLDESFNRIAGLKILEAQMANTVEWERLPTEEREERTRLFQHEEQTIGWDMKLANEDIGMLAYTSADITAPFLLQEMVERVANMLNYFLKQLVGPEYKTLDLKDREKYEFRPKQLLKQIVQIYVHLSRGDNSNVFPSAISSDGRSYKDELFCDAAQVLQRIGEDGKIIEEFVDLGAKAKAAAIQSMDIEDMLGDIPDEFLDPVKCTLMRDPVILPSSRTTMDRCSIERHLLNDSSDPFNRFHLTPDMLIPNTELKAEIEDLIRGKSSTTK